ncbi:unnamed protein product [Rotaria sp. Silwood2]|nr:unnamed protein product [Rotaria sp. Silwood2]CAF4023959.1 unnamed protein product [Rotaria sp. Silwood2]
MMELTDQRTEYDVLQFIDQLVIKLKGKSFDGICSASDYPGILIAAALVHELKIPIGYNLLGTYRCSHKYYSRLIQSQLVPEACPNFFALIDESSSEFTFPYPIFVKPVKSCLSQNAHRINNADELKQLLKNPKIQSHLTTFVHPFNQLIERYVPANVFQTNVSYMLAEELLSGHQFTVDGYVDGNGEVTILGMTDTIMDSNKVSYLRFDHPTNLLPSYVQQRAKDICQRIVKGIDLRWSLFNIEFYYNQENDDLKIIEINPRHVGLFGDMYELVHGQNTYEIMLDLSMGQATSFRSVKPSYSHASSIMLHLSSYKKATIVKHVPSMDNIQAVLKKFPMVSLITVTCEVGMRLDADDRLAYGYGYINIGGNSMEEIDRNFKLAKENLDFEFEFVND